MLMRQKTMQTRRRLGDALELPLGCEGTYQLLPLGRTRRLPKRGRRFWSPFSGETVELCQEVVDLVRRAQVLRKQVSWVVFP